VPPPSPHQDRGVEAHAVFRAEYGSKASGDDDDDDDNDGGSERPEERNPKQSACGLFPHQDRGVEAHAVFRAEYGGVDPGAAGEGHLSRDHLSVIIIIIIIIINIIIIIIIIRMTP
jgi:hypothetical protein